MIYLSIKALHIVAVILWIGSFVLVAAITASSKLNSDQMRIAVRVTESAIGVTWLAGIALVVMGSWYTSTWWIVKIVVVIAISAVHTFLHRRWKAANSDENAAHPLVWVVLIGLTLLVVLLAVFKQPV